MPRLKIRVDRDVCIGAASCTIVSPGTFKIDNENKAVIIDPQDPTKTHNELELEVDDAKKQEIVDAARSCPVAAIFVQDENGNQIYP